MPSVILIDNYDSFTWNLVHYLGSLGADVSVHRNDEISAADVVRAQPDAILLSPGPCTPKEAGICIEMVKAADETRIPLFGVCLGHQTIGHVYGGDVIRAPHPMHGKMSEIAHRGQGVFRGINGPFQATRYHSLIVDRATMPDALAVTAEADDLVMGLQHRTKPIHGVQFHPESIQSEHGRTILKNFLDLAAEWNRTHRPKKAAQEQ